MVPLLSQKTRPSVFLKLIIYSPKNQYTVSNILMVMCSEEALKQPVKTDGLTNM